MKLMLLTFGPNIKNHYQACFAILTLLRDTPRPDVTVYTDVPEFYRYFGSAIRIEPLSEQGLAQWRGSHDFFWRIKCKAFEDMVRRHPGEHVVYLDSDTFAAPGWMQTLNAKLDAGHSVMHLKEGALSELGSKTEKRMARVLVGGDYTGVPVKASTAMWNAGVVAVAGDRAARAAELSVQLCDAFCETSAPRRLLEQFAFSVALNQVAPLVAADDCIGHYWGNKEQWNEAIGAFFLHSRLYNRTLEEDIAALDDFEFGEMALHIRYPSTHRRLQRLIGRWFPPRPGAYFR